MKPRKSNTLAKAVVSIAAYILCCLISIHAGRIMSTEPDKNWVLVFYKALLSFQQDPFNLVPFYAVSFKYIAIMTGVFIVVLLLLKFDAERNRRTAPGKENGSAQWNTDMNKFNRKFNEPFGSVKSDSDNNIILSNDVRLSINAERTRRNLNGMIIGDAGSGKSRNEVKPNILQANTSYVITDPSGELLESTGKFLEEQGYRIRVFNLVEFSHSNCYNPFEYIEEGDELGVLTMIDCLIQNTTPIGAPKGDPFWEKSEKTLLQALSYYLIKYRPKEERNFASIMRLLRAAEINEDKPKEESSLDKLFNHIEKVDPESIALKQYKLFKIGAGKTLKSILISCGSRLASFNLRDFELLTSSDGMDLKTIGDVKTAVFVIIPQTHSTFNFLVSMMYSQMFLAMYHRAEIVCPKGYYIQDSHRNNICFKETKEAADEYLGQNPGYKKVKGKKHLCHHVRFMLDEFANIGQIPEFDKKLSTMRKYWISCTIILQSISQLKALYEKQWGTIVNNCNSFIFLGGQELETLEYVSKMLGDATIIVRNNSRSRGNKSGSSLSFNHTARKLMTPDEIRKIDEDYLILIIRGLDPFYTKKFDYEKHKNYQFTGDASRKNIFDVSKQINNSQLDLEIEEDEKECLNTMARMKLLNEITTNKQDYYLGRKRYLITEAKPLTLETFKELDIQTPSDIPKKLGPFNRNISDETLENIKNNNTDEKETYVFV